MQDKRKGNKQIQDRSSILVPLQNLNLMDDFLFDIATLDLELCKIILNTKGRNNDEVEQTLIDFLHYVEHSTEERVPDGCHERLKYLHEKIKGIKSNEQMGVTYMKMEERDRLIKEDGVAEGIEKGIAALILDNLEEGRTEDEITDKLIRRFSLSCESAREYYKRYRQMEEL